MSMRSWPLAVLILLAAGLSAAADDFDAQDMRLLRNPDLHGGTIVFVQGGDLWTVPAAGGEARRLTSHIGFESQPKFSPDGKWIAFSGDYDGNRDVYVIPAAGGEPRRLTWHPLGDRVIDWQPDGKAVRFQSSRTSFTMREQQLWTVPLTGGLPQMLPLPEGGLSSWSPDGRRLAYNRITSEGRTWKRYQGGMAQDIWIHDFDKGTTSRITDWPGAENYPMWHGDTIYFTSDRTGRLQIWAYDTVGGGMRQVTDHAEYDVKEPSLGDDAIVYENGGWLHVLDLATGKSRRVTVAVHDDFFRTRPAFVEAAGRITGFGIGPDAQRAVFAARGEIFTVPAEKGEVRNLTDTPAVNEVLPAWSPDGKWIAYFGDASGEYELTLRRGDGSGEERRLTSGSGTYYVGLRWSPDSSKILTYDAAMMLRWVDAGSGEQHDISGSPTERSFDAAWSPDSRWVAFAEAEENEFSSIFLFDTKDGSRSRVTTSMTDDTSPTFSPDGKYLYFASERSFQPSFGPYDQVPHWSATTGLYLATLQADEPHPFPPESDEVAVEGEGDDEDKDKDKGKDADKDDADDAKKDDDEKKVEPTVIDRDGIGNRIVALDVPPGSYGNLAAGEGKLFYLKRDPQADNGELMVFDLEKREAETVLAKADAFELDAKGAKLLYREGKTFGIIDAAADQKPAEKPLRTADMKARSDPRAEWRQMFHDAWRLESDFFYDPGMHGVDWDHMHERYGQLVPYVTDRRDLDYVLGELIGELGAGHAYVNGSGEAPKAKPVGVGLLGADFRLDTASGRYQLVNILTERDWNEDQRTPLAGPGLDVREGDYLLAVDGKPLQAPTNPYSLFENKVDVRTVLTVAGKPGGKEREVVVLPIDSETGLRYVKWVEGNRRRVAELTGGKVGYIHLPDTAVDGVQAFAQAYYPQVRLEGLIIDERFNSGGFVPDFLLNILGQDFLNLWKPRYGRDWRTPGTAFNGPLVMVSNSHAGSGGDALPYYFKRYGLGKVVGTRTWGGLIGISSRIPLMDGGLVTFPEFGLFNLEGAWDVENHGVDPDIVVENLPEEVNRGRDPQLERAVAEVMAAMKERRELPAAPAFPRGR